MKRVNSGMRLDQKLVDCGLCPSRTKAKDLILAGAVKIQKNDVWVPIKSPSHFFEGQCHEISISSHPLQKFVSRAGLKLDGALDHLNMSVAGMVALDVGQSTGGFTDCLLQRDIRSVVGVDVGQDQIHYKVSEDPRVEVIEKFNAKDFKSQKNYRSQWENHFDLIVMDVSFISIRQILPNLGPMLKSNSHLISLVKPQFELSSDRLNKKGVVKENADFDLVRSSVKECLNGLGSLNFADYFESSILGKDGNKEFFVYAKK